MLLLGGFYLWKVVDARRAESRHEEALAQRTEELLELSTIPLGFAVRSAALGGNLGEIGAYFDRMVSEPGVERAAFADATGTIRVASDQALVGSSLGEEFAGLDPEVAEATVMRAEGRWHAVVPITGLNERLGVVVLTYAPADSASAPAAAP